LVASDAELELEPRPPALVLGFGNVSEAQISKGIRKLAEAVRQETLPPGEIGKKGL
jgi:GntR family transcriptional regulator/MocR family aminotransferase